MSGRFTRWRRAGLIFRDGCPDGEAPEEVGARVDRMIARSRAVDGDIALFARGHVLLRSGRCQARRAVRAVARLVRGVAYRRATDGAAQEQERDQS